MNYIYVGEILTNISSNQVQMEFEDVKIIGLLEYLHETDYDKNKLAWIIYSEIFSKEYTQEDLNKIYDEAISYTRNKNKYGLHDFNDYNKVITTIFNIK